MEAKWLEDFLSVARTGSFSQSAAERNVTQPAFSRRIKALEEWVGVALIDRSSYPTRLTPAGETFVEAVRAARNSLQTARQELRRAARADRSLLRIAIQHSLATGFLARWLASLPLAKEDLLVQVRADNRHDCVRGLEDGNVDLLVCYTHPAVPLELDPARYTSQPLASDTLMPVSKPGEDGRPLHALHEGAASPVNWLSYGPDAFLGRAVARALHQTSAPALHPVLESTLVETLRSAAIEGLGVAWLPGSLIANELNAKSLVRAGSGDYEVPLTVMAFAERALASGRLRPVWGTRQA